jgi:hypothetical protein
MWRLLWIVTHGGRLTYAERWLLSDDATMSTAWVRAAAREAKA